MDDVENYRNMRTGAESQNKNQIIFSINALKRSKAVGFGGLQQRFSEQLLWSLQSCYLQSQSRESVISPNERQKEMIDNADRRVNSSRCSFVALSKIWICPSLDTNIKLKLFCTNVSSVLLYGKVTFTVTQNLQAFVNTCL